MGYAETIAAAAEAAPSRPPAARASRTPTSARVLENGIREISGEVRNSLDFHRSQDAAARSPTSCSAAPRSICPASPRRCRRRSASRCAARPSASSTRASTGKVSTHRLAVAAGLAADGGAAMRAVNLIPSDERSRRVGRRRALAAAAPTRCSACSAGSPCSRCSTASPATRSPSRRAQAASLTARSPARAGSGRGSWRRTRASSRCANSACRRSPTLVDSRFDWAHAFHELGRVLPRDAAITSLDGTVGATSASAPSAADAPRRLPAHRRRRLPAAAAPLGVPRRRRPGASRRSRSSGCATSQPEVALTLERLRLIDGVSEVTLQSSTKAAASGAGASSSSAAVRCTSSPAFTRADHLRPAADARRRSARRRKLTASDTGAGR